MKNRLLFTFLVLLLFSAVNAQLCPTCIIDQGAHPSNGPQDFSFVPGTASVVRGEDTCLVLQFLLPSEFDASAQSGGVVGILDIYDIEVLSVTGLPSGYSHFCNIPSCFYDLSISRYGCVTMEGNTLAPPGVYNLDVTVRANTSLSSTLGGPYQNLNIPLQLTVVASSGGNIIADNILGCDSVSTSLTSGLEFPPNPSIYSWDLDGNGTWDATGAFIDTMSFYTVGNAYTTHEVYMRTELLNYVITDVSFTAGNQSLWDGDNWGAGEDCTPIVGNCLPDVFATIYSSGGAPIGNLGVVDNNVTPSWGGLNIQLIDPNFSITFIEEDPFTGSDDQLGTAIITAPNASGSFNGQNWNVTYTTVVASTYFDTLTVEVYPQSPVPMITNLTGSNVLCPSDSITLESSIGDSYQWYLDNVLITGATNQSLTVGSEGDYSVEVVAVGNICATFSAIYDVVEDNVTAPVIASTTDGGIYVANSNSYAVQWFANGSGVAIPIPGANSDTLATFNPNNAPFTVSFTSANGCSSLSLEFSLCIAGTSSASSTNLTTSNSIDLIHDGFTLKPTNDVAWAISTSADGAVTDMTSLQAAIDAGWVLPSSSDSGVTVDCSSLPSDVGDGDYYFTPLSAAALDIDSILWNPAVDSGCVPDAEFCLEISGTDWLILGSSLTFTFPDGSVVNILDELIPPGTLPAGIVLDTLTPGLVALIPTLLPDGLCFQLSDLYNGDPNGTWSVSAENVGTGTLNVEIFDFTATVYADSCSLLTSDQVTSISGQLGSISGGQSGSISFTLPPLSANFPTINADCNVFGEATLLTIDCPTSIQDVVDLNSFNLYPNPNNGSFTVAMDVTERSEVKIQIVDITGRTILNTNYPSVLGSFNEKFNLSNNMSAGFYVLNMQIGDNQIQKHFIVK